MDPIPQRVFKPSSTMFSADVANMHWLLTMHLQCRINLCTGWGSEIRKKTYDDISDLYLRNDIKIEHFIIIFMLGYPFLTLCFNLSIPTRVRL